jgi:glycosyltransferase involved in cell wall biosynthesis
MKKLLIFHPFLTTYRLDLYNYLAKKFDCKVTLYKPFENDLGFDKNELNQHAKFNFLYLKNGIQIGTQIIHMGLFKVLIKFKPDIVLPHEFGFNAIATITFRSILGYKIFITCDDSPIMAKDCKGLRNFFRTFCIKRINGLILVNPQTIEILKEKYPATNCKFFYYPILQEEKNIQIKLSRSLPIALKYISQYDLKDIIIFLYVGRLVDVKGLDILIAAFSIIYHNNMQARLVIVGDGEKKENLNKQALSLGLENAVIFTGKKMNEELFAWYRLGQIFILPSRFEPFGAVVNEALICGCKVIVSDQVGASCLINNENGYIFKNNSINNLADFMQNSLKDIENSKIVNQRKNKMIMSFKSKTEELIDFLNL